MTYRDPPKTNHIATKLFHVSIYQIACSAHTYVVALRIQIIEKSVTLAKLPIEMETLFHRIYHVLCITVVSRYILFDNSP